MKNQLPKMWGIMINQSVKLLGLMYLLTLIAIPNLYCMEDQHNEKVEKQETCPICFELLSSSQMEVFELGCKHIYCRECITKWINTKIGKASIPNCPFCRKKITKQERNFLVPPQDKSLHLDESLPAIITAIIWACWLSI